MVKKISLKDKKKEETKVEDSPLRTRLKQTSLLKPLPPKKYMEFVSSGSWILNLSLTNNIDHGYPVGRVVNVVSDKSVGKTLLACEVVNSVWYYYHILQGKKVKIYYDEPETAFDMDLAIKFNMPLSYIIGLRERLSNWKEIKKELSKEEQKEFKHSKLVEDFYTNIKDITDEEENKKESEKYDLILYVIDSLDSVSDAREIKHISKKGVGKQDFGGGKARVLSQMFRTCIQKVKNSNIILFIVSQVRENFDAVMFGPKYTRAGGKALDHYASVICWLKEVGKIEAENGLNIGIEVESLLDKNKTGSRYNKLRFQILHGYGIDNFSSAVNFLWDKGGFTKSGNYIIWLDEKKYYRSELIEKAANEPEIAQQLKDMLQNHWTMMVEEASIKRPPKYGK